MDPRQAIAFFDELEKISAAQEYLQERQFEQEKNSDGVPERQEPVTKKRLKQLAIMLPVAAAGTGLGVAAGRAMRNYLASPSGAARALRQFEQHHPKMGPILIRGVPPAAVAMGTLAAGLGVMKAQKVRDWIESRHEGTGPK